MIIVIIIIVIVIVKNSNTNDNFNLRCSSFSGSRAPEAFFWDHGRSAAEEGDQLACICVHLATRPRPQRVGALQQVGVLPCP